MNKNNKALFDELEIWSRQKNAFSINDFLKQKSIQINEFENMANSSKKFMKMWGKAESQAWENVLNALFTKSLSRSQIAKYIKESDIAKTEIPEEVMRELERTQAMLELHLTAIGDTESLRKYGRIGCNFNR